MSAERDEAVRARAELRRHRVGALLSDGRPRRLCFVDDPASGALAAPLPEAALDAMEHVLFVPEESDEALQLLLAPELERPVPEALIDRWRIHHGATPDEEVFWARCAIETARFGSSVIEGEALMRPNPLGAHEGGACRRVNEDRAALGRACARVAGVRPTDPMCVGLDDEGLHVRHKLGVLRVPFPRAARDARDADALIDELLRGGES